MLIPFTGALGICPVPQERQPCDIPTVDTLALSRYARQGCHAARMMPALVSIMALGPWSLVWLMEPSNHILDKKEYGQIGWVARAEGL